MKRKSLFFKWMGVLLMVVAGTAGAAEFDAPEDDSDVIGEVKHIKAKESDTFVKLAQKYNLGYLELRNANPKVDPWLPGEGTKITLPTQYVLPDVPRKGIIINLPEMRVYYFPEKGSEDEDKVFTYPVGVGRQGWSTPVKETEVSEKIEDPTWTPPESIKKEHEEEGDPLPDVVPAGEDNPMGEHALRLGMPQYLLHGTNKPAGIGMPVSHGCIRLFPDDIKELFSKVESGTPVNIIAEPFKVGWQDDRLVMEAHPTDPSNDDDDKQAVESYTPWVQSLISATRDKPKIDVDWDAAHKLVDESSGIPGVISGKLKDEDDDSDED